MRRATTARRSRLTCRAPDVVLPHQRPAPMHGGRGRHRRRAAPSLRNGAELPDTETDPGSLEDADDAQDAEIAIRWHDERDGRPAGWDEYFQRSAVRTPRGGTPTSGIRPSRPCLLRERPRTDRVDDAGGAESPPATSPSSVEPTMTVKAHVARALAITAALERLHIMRRQRPMRSSGARTLAPPEQRTRVSGPRVKQATTGPAAGNASGPVNAARHLDRPDQRQEVDAGAGRDRADDAAPVPSKRARQ